MPRTAMSKSLRCDFCGTDEDLPFTCNYCGGTFCAEHRLPESHACKGDMTRRIVAQPNTTRSWDGSTLSGTASGRSTNPFIFAAPGATYIQGYNVSDRQNGIISLAGPLTNVVIAFVFFIVGMVGPGIVGTIGMVGSQVNLFLATFNMLPVMPLDGAKVFHWNKAIWGAVFVP